MARVGRSETSDVGAEPAYCPACDLKQVRQPDWLCTRCGQPVETEGWRSAVGGRAAGPERERALEFPLGSVVAGAVMALTSLVIAIGFARSPATAHRWALVAAAVVLLVLGVELLLKVRPARWIVIAAALMALSLAAEGVLRERVPELVRDPLPPGVRVALRSVIHALHPLRILLASGLLGGILLLVAGRPGRWRMAAGVLIAAPLALGEIIRWVVQ
jgi:hypothetical protein